MSTLSSDRDRGYFHRNTVLHSLHIVVIYCLPRQKLTRNVATDATVFRHVKECIDDLPQVSLAAAADLDIFFNNVLTCRREVGTDFFDSHSSI
jgi:hypothetical protein